MLKKGLLVLFNLLLICWLVECETASFYGMSYITVPLQEAKSTMQVNFKFLTKRSDAIMILAAGRIDYCLIKLEAGRLKVHINLGAGEYKISSPRNLRLDDLQWHTVSITRKEADISLIIDNIHVSREKLPGRFFELNIHYGLFIGGQGEFSELFLGHDDWMRGCISDFTYNGIYPLVKARQRQGQGQAHGVTWTCAQEFLASANEEISFVDDGAFMTLPNIITRVGSRWELELKTTSPDGLILYTSDGSENSDFVSVEILNHHIRLILNKGGGPTEIINDLIVTDGKWHKIMINFNSSIAQLTVDYEESAVKLIQTATRYFDLGDVFYVGGIHLAKRSRAFLQGIKTADISLKGCLRHIHFNNKAVGFPQARITQGLVTQCVWSYPCSQNPCIENSTCIHKGVNSFVCLCNQPYCVKTNFGEALSVYSKISQLQLLDLKPLTVLEGQNVLITTSNIDIVLDYAKFGVRDSGVLFSIVQSQPIKHGRLAVEVWEKQGTRQVFTLLDLSKDKVRYIHDGTENFFDDITMDLEFLPKDGYILPGYLQGQHRFILHVNVTPVNDPPSLFLPSNKIIRLAEGTRKVLNNNLLNVSDPDTPRENLIYTISVDESGRIENLLNPGVAITKFSQREIDDNTIVYYNNGKNSGNNKITIQASDGLLKSQAASLRINVFPLTLRLINNTGVLLTYKSTTSITPNNLTFTTNSEDPMVILNYKIVEKCEFGVIERFHGISEQESSWQEVTQFLSTQLLREEIRYRHTIGRPVQDIFKFKISAYNTDFPTTYNFRIEFTELRLHRIIFNKIDINGKKIYVFSRNDILYTTVPIEKEPKNIIYILKKLPVYGSLILSNDVEEARIVIGQNFTQHDINTNRLKYVLFRSAYSKLKENITLSIYNELCESNLNENMEIEYVPSSPAAHVIKITLKTLQVMEGGVTPIKSSDLNIKAPSIKSLIYEITQGPFYGVLQLVDSIQNTTEYNITHFTPSQIASQKLIYVNDGSENVNDFIEFIAVSDIEDDFMTVGTLNISITLVNDNPPVRVVKSIFRVVTGGQRILSTRHLKFKDDDQDFNANDLVYTVINGTGIFSSDNAKHLNQFTQGDLESDKVLIVENGESQNRILLLVSDGTHTTECVLEIRPSPPYIEITNNSHLVVSQGGQATVTSSNLYSDTNINIKVQEIKYDILSGPNHGELFIAGRLESKTFTQGQIENNQIYYKHSAPSVTQDRIHLKVYVENISAEGWLTIRIYPPSYWEPLNIIVNQTIFVEESTSIAVTSKYLKTKQSGIPPSDIIYIVVSGPRFGYLEIEGTEDRINDDEEERDVHAFDQATIDSGKLRYIQTTNNVTIDKIIVDITNGIIWLHSLQINLEIIPLRIYLSSKAISVLEGEFVKLSSDIITINTPYYENKIIDYQIQIQPKFGSLILLPLNKTVTKWTMKQLKSGLIQYSHDGSESSLDSFTVVGSTVDKTSEAVNITIKIIPVNDIVPRIIKKSPFSIWKGSSQILTNSSLAAIDEDTSSEELIFEILNITGGYVSTLENNYKSLFKFSQHEIDENELLFVSNGENKFEVKLSLNDGNNFVEPFILKLIVQTPEIKIINNNDLHIFPLLRKQITKNELHSICTDSSREIIYTINIPPKMGKILYKKDLNSGKFQQISNFSQTDINSNSVWYHHSDKVIDGSVTDFFNFDISSDYAEKVVNNVFKIQISVMSGGLDQILEATQFELQVEEGSTTIIPMNSTKLLNFLRTSIGLDNPIIHGIVTSLPKHGKLCVKFNCNITNFTHDQLEFNDLLYKHDDSETLKDDFFVSLYLIPSDVLLCNLSFYVNVHPIDDQPFNLVTANPFINVVQGQEIAISSNELLTVDSDTEPSRLIYDIITGPAFGSLTKNNKTIRKFNQADINSKNIIFKHESKSNSLEPTSFYFRVSDQQFNPTYAVFKINVEPISLKIVVKYPLLLQQENSIVQLNEEIFDIMTNINKSKIIFNVTTLPRYGKIFIGEIPSLYFNFEQILEKKVIYMKTEITSPNDSFELNGFIDSGHLVSHLWINITVTPYVNFGNFSPISGENTKLNLSIIDASALAKLSNSNPIYKLIKPPKYGRLKKIVQSSGDRKQIHEKDIMKFTHQDIQNGVIYYICRKILESVEDRLPFLLMARNIQPAVGEWKFHVIGEIKPTTFEPPRLDFPRPKSPVGHDGVQIASPNMSDDYLLGVSLVAGIVAFALLIVIFVRCGSNNSEENIILKPDLPEPLPQPPDDLLPASPALVKRSTVENEIKPKIISDSVTSSEPELNLRYPYGDEDWSSYDTSDTNATNKNVTNPMLRKNQYWV